jgi:hypothetical protein
VFILAVSAVLQGPLDPLTGPALGFGAGVVIGMIVSNGWRWAMPCCACMPAGTAIAEACAAQVCRHQVRRTGRDGEITAQPAIARRDIAAQASSPDRSGRSSPSTRFNAAARIFPA